MTAAKILRLGGTLGLVWALGACGSDEHTGEDGSDGAPDGSDGSDGTPDGDDGTPDGDDGTPDGDDGQDGSLDGSDGSPDGSDGADGMPDGNDGSPGGCEGDAACGGDTPACVDGTCVECSDTNATQCEANEVCDTSRNTCVNKLTPFSLNCADLPTDGACQGGPVEVLLATMETGYIGMFDPVDGHFLGNFKRITVPSKVNLDSQGEERSGEYVYATQGADQCIWAVGDDERGVERWDTDGKFKDNIIPYDRYWEGQNQLIDDVHHVAFTRDSVYVASSYGYPNARLVRFDLDALNADTPSPADSYEVVMDDGSEFESVIVLGDGSLVIANGDTGRVEYIPADGSGVEPLLSSVWAYQVTYAGGGEVLAIDHSLSGSAYRIDILTGMYSAEMRPFGDSFNMNGIAPLENGHWLITGGDNGVSSLDPSESPATPPPGQYTRVWDDPGAGSVNFEMIGRACLSEEFVASRAPDAPITDCSEPAGEAIYAQNFETGDFSGAGDQRSFDGFFERPANGVTVSIDPTLGAGDSARSLKIDGGLQLSIYDNPSGVARALPAGTKPSYISYNVRLDETNTTGGYFIMNPAAEGELDAIMFLSGGYFTTWNFNSSVEAMRDQWLKVQLRDIDWEDRTYDLYLNCERIANDVSFGIYGGDDLHAIELQNYTSTAVAWYDDIVIK